MTVKHWLSMLTICQNQPMNVVSHNSSHGTKLGADHHFYLSIPLLNAKALGQW
jgi:hypothetical protein